VVDETPLHTEGPNLEKVERESVWRKPTVLFVTAVLKRGKRRAWRMTKSATCAEAGKA
jgi:hypothetical protein